MKVMLHRIRMDELVSIFVQSCFIFTFIYTPIHTGDLIPNWTLNKFIIKGKIFHLQSRAIKSFTDIAKN